MSVMVVLDFGYLGIGSLEMMVGCASFGDGGWEKVG